MYNTSIYHISKAMHRFINDPIASICKTHFQYNNTIQLYNNYVGLDYLHFLHPHYASLKLFLYYNKEDFFSSTFKERHGCILEDIR